jgi:hypothetical protein
MDYPYEKAKGSNNFVAAFFDLYSGRRRLFSELLFALGPSGE